MNAVKFSVMALLALAGANVARADEPPILASQVAQGLLPPMAKRIPEHPFVTAFEGRGRNLGRYGGSLRSLIAKARDVRFVSVYSYARLVGYDERLSLVPDILERFENFENRVFTLTLRSGHRWSDGAPFTSEDFRFYWDDIALNRDLSPQGPPAALLVDGELPRFEVLDEHRVRYSWSKPNPLFAPMLARPRPVYIYAPAHYLKRFHAAYTDAAELQTIVAREKLRSWAALLNRRNDPDDYGNPDMPTLAAWNVKTAAPANRFVFERNPYYHRVDPSGRQLPYIDRLVFDIASTSLFAAKANAGEVDLLARGLTIADIPILKEGEPYHNYNTLIWSTGRGSAYALYPNLNTNDRAWRDLVRDVRFRRALSLGIDRTLINNALAFGLGVPGNNTVMEQSPLFRPELRSAWARHDPVEARRLLLELGLRERRFDPVLRLPDGRRAEIVVEFDGEDPGMSDAVELIGENLADIGLKIVAKPQDRSVLRRRAYSGQTLMSAAPGLDNALPTAEMPPFELAPTQQDRLSWPKWGQHFETGGSIGEAPDMAEAATALELARQWLSSQSEEGQQRAWRALLDINADQVWSIGTIAGAPHPIVVSRDLRNVPRDGLYSWEPGALIGLYRMDEFYFDPDLGRRGSPR
jgi:peptide/nickel transport system substrate-binding protein